MEFSKRKGVGFQAERDVSDRCVIKEIRKIRGGWIILNGLQARLNERLRLCILLKRDEGVDKGDFVPIFRIVTTSQLFSMQL